MVFHTSKCQVISITNKAKPIIGKYQVHDQILEEVNCAKYLGIYIDSKLAFNAHVDAIVKKANSTRAFLARNIHRCCRKGKQMAYTTYIRPTAVANAARVILRLPMSSSITIHLKSLHWLPVKVRSTYKIACLCYHCHSSTAPSYVSIYPIYIYTLVNTLYPIYIYIYPSADLPSIFIKHFSNKAEKLRANIASEHVTSTLVTGTTAATFSSIEKVSQLTVKECILNSAPKSCELDPIPSKLLIECLDSILPSLTDLFNSSLASGIFPQCFKSALVTPILKKRCLDHNDLNNYRPVSNLCFIAKILEKLVLSQVSSYLNSHNLYNTCQSAYRPGHSTETALLKVVNDLFLSLNKGNISVLALLDFSSAFDTIDHTILVQRLHTDFGFTDTVLQWFSSYLTDRTHYVSLCNHCSDFAPVHSGVTQGSVLGPMVFTMYIKPLSAIIDSHSIIHHSFADDLQLQMLAPPDRISELLHSMQSCISDVKAWATANMLKLNDSKTELMLVTSKRSKHLHNLPTSITIGNAQIPFKQSVKNLGFTLDCHLTMNAHVSNIARTCYF